MCVCVCGMRGGGEVEGGVWRSSCGGGGGIQFSRRLDFGGGSILKMHKSHRTIIS